MHADPRLLSQRCGSAEPCYRATITFLESDRPDAPRAGDAYGDNAITGGRAPHLGDRRLNSALHEQSVRSGRGAPGPANGETRARVRCDARLGPAARDRTSSLRYGALRVRPGRRRDARRRRRAGPSKSVMCRPKHHSGSLRAKCSFRWIGVISVGGARFPEWCGAGAGLTMPLRSCFRLARLGAEAP
jgi:hypothetical protein